MNNTDLIRRAMSLLGKAGRGASKRRTSDHYRAAACAAWSPQARAKRAATKAAKRTRPNP